MSGEGRRRGGQEPADHRRRLLVTLAVVVGVVAVMAGGPWLYAQLVVNRPAAPLELTAPTATAVPSGPPVSAGPLDLDGVWRVGEDSEAGYRLGEVLSGTQVTVVGRTDQVEGTFEVQDGVLVAAQVVVDVGSISTDESARDAYFRRALDTSTFPQARFELGEPVDVSALRQPGAQLDLQLPGTLTLRDVTVPTTVTLMARADDAGRVEAAGSAPLVLQDVGLTAPQLPFVTVEPEGTVEMRLVLTR